MKTIVSEEQLKTIEIAMLEENNNGQDQHISLPPDNIEFDFEAYDKLLFEGIAKRQAKSILKSLAIFDQAIASVPDKGYASEALFEKAISLEMLGFYHEAKSVLEILLNISHSTPEYHYHLGLCDTALGHYESALSSFRSALEFGDTSAELKTHMINAYKAAGIWDEVMKLQAA